MFSGGFDLATQQVYQGFTFSKCRILGLGNQVLLPPILLVLLHIVESGYEELASGLVLE